MTVSHNNTVPSFENKLVAIINKKIDVGIAMNAMAHAALGFGAVLTPEPLRLIDYKDKDGKVYPNISQMPFMILRGKSNEIRKTINIARDENMQFSAFTDTMTGGTYEEQLERSLNTPEEELVFYGGIIFGPWNRVSEITKRFSLYGG